MGWQVIKALTSGHIENTCSRHYLLHITEEILPAMRLFTKRPAADGADK